MKITTITIDGVKYPVRFGLRAYRDFENHTGKVMSELNPTKLKIDDFIALSYFGLVDGAKKASQPLPPKNDLDWLLDVFDEDQSIIEKFTDVLIDAQRANTKVNEKNGATKKKKLRR